MIERDDLYLLSGAYALGALDGPEKDEFEAYLLDNEELRTEVAGMSETAVLLGLSARPIAPPPALKESIMALVDGTPQFAPMATAAPAAPHLAAVPSTQSQTTGYPTAAQQASIASIADGTGRRSERRAKTRWFARPVGVLAAAAAAVAIFASGSLLGQGLTGPGSEQQQASSLAELTAASDLESSVSAIDGGGSAKLIWSPELERSAMLVDDLPALDGGQTYQLWYIDGSGPRSAGLFDAASTGTSWRVLDGSKSDDDAVGITVEPEGGSSAPTTDPILVIAAA